MVGCSRLERLHRFGEGAAALGAVIRRASSAVRASAREAVGELDQVVAAPLRRIVTLRSRTVGRASRASPRASARNGPSRSGHRLGGVHERIHVVERGPEVHERGVGAAHERRQPVDRLGQGALLVAQRAEGGVEVADQRR